MNKKIDLKKHVISLFVINIVSVLLMLLLKGIYDRLGFWKLLTNMMLIVNVIAIIIGIVFNYLFFKDDKYDNKKSFILPIVIFIVLQVLNVLGVYAINKIHDASYSDLTNNVAGFCAPEKFYCDSYEIVKNTNYNDFISHKSYYDYDNNKNSIEIHTRYTSDKIVSIEAIIYSNKNSYSAYLIKKVINKYFENVNYKVSDKKISEAFEKRFENAILVEENDKKIEYRVKEIYKNKKLDKLSTIIKVEYR